MPASWVIGPESIPLRPLRKTSGGRERERKRENTEERGGGEEVRSERLAESVGQGGVRRDSRKEVFLSRSTAAQSHTQYFPLAGTHFALTHTSAYSHACYLTAARTTAFDPRVF